jgi:hypothetical protein
MTAKKMADIFFGKFSELISEKPTLNTEEKVTIDNKNQNIKKKKSNKILMYSAIIIIGILVYLIN